MVDRVVTSYHSPRILLPLNWGSSGTAWVGKNGGTNALSVTSEDPNTNAFPWYYATARAGIDGNLTIALTGGFTEPVSLVAFEWNKVANAWIRLGPNSGVYETSFDSTYAQNVFQTSESAYVLIQSTAAITGSILTDGMLDNIVPPVLQEGG